MLNFLVFFLFIREMQDILVYFFVYSSHAVLSTHLNLINPPAYLPTYFTWIIVLGGSCSANIISSWCYSVIYSLNLTTSTLTPPPLPFVQCKYRISLGATVFVRPRQDWPRTAALAVVLPVPHRHRDKEYYVCVRYLGETEVRLLGYLRMQYFF